MCFSATASFASSAVLITGGSLALHYYKPNKRHLLLAILPVIFGVHQFIEGLVWLGINQVVDTSIQTVAMYVFTFIAMCLWPIYIPLALFVYEKPRRKTAFITLLSLGILVSGYLLWCFTIYSDLYINVQCCNSIAYLYRLPYLYGIIDYFYVLIVVLPFLLSSNPRIRYLLGPGFLGTFLIALMLESGGDYPSIWCFLAAALSITTIYALRFNNPAAS